MRTLEKTIANLLINEVQRLIKETGIELEQSKLTPQHLAEIAILMTKDDPTILDDFLIRRGK